MSQKQAVKTDKAPAVRGPYSQAVRYGDLLFVSGQVPVDLAGNPVGAGDIEAQTHQVIANLKGILESQGTMLDNVLKVTVYLQDLAEWPRMNAVYAEYFKKDPPARAAVQTDFSGLKNHWRIEMEAVAAIPEK